MQCIPAAIPDVKLLTPVCHRDERGFFSETYSRRTLASIGIDVDFVQDSHSQSIERGVVRGLHFQIPPFAQAKLIRVVRGAIFDVAVDIRRDSPTFGEHVTCIVGEKNWQQVFVPVGFAHGFATLEPDTEVIYKVSNPYAPVYDRGIPWDDPTLAIDWPVKASEAILSARDQEHPRWEDVEWVTW